MRSQNERPHLHGDLGRRHVWRAPVANRMTVLRDVMRNADITVGNMEGGVGFDPALTAARSPTWASIPGAGRVVAGRSCRCHGGPGQVRDQVAGAGPNLTRAATRAPGSARWSRWIHPCLPGTTPVGLARRHGTGGESARRDGVENGHTQQFNQLKALEASIVRAGPGGRARRSSSRLLCPLGASGGGRTTWWGKSPANPATS